MKATDKLRAYWGKRDRDLILCYPVGQGTRQDARLISDHIGQLVDELARRGYDKTTVKFSIEPVAGDQRFASQREDES